MYFTNEYLYRYRRNDPNIVLISSIVIGDRCAHNLDELLVPHGSIGLDAGLAEDLVNCNKIEKIRSNYDREISSKSKTDWAWSIYTPKN